jgi:hypothetical protein
MGSAQSQGVDFQLRYLLGEERYARVDFNLPDKTWALDCVAVVDQLVHLGHEAAHTRGAEMLERFFADPAPAYTPFPVRRDLLLDGNLLFDRGTLLDRRSSPR